MSEMGKLVWHILGIRRFYPKHMPNSVLVTYEAMIINMFATPGIKAFISGDYQSVIGIKQVLPRPTIIRGGLPIVINLVVCPNVEDFQAAVGILADREGLRPAFEAVFPMPPDQAGVFPIVIEIVVCPNVEDFQAAVGIPADSEGLRSGRLRLVLKRDNSTPSYQRRVFPSVIDIVLESDEEHLQSAVGILADSNC